MAKGLFLERFGKTCKKLREKSGHTVLSLASFSERLGSSEFQFTHSTVSRWENGEFIPSATRLLAMAKGCVTPLSEYYRALGATDTEICGHTLTPQQQAVVDQLHSADGEYLLKVRWLLAEGRENQKQLIRSMLDELAKEAPADDLRPPAAVVDLTDSKVIATDDSDDSESVRRYRAEDVRLAAGSGALVDQEPIPGEIKFMRTWLRSHGLQAKNLLLVNVIGDSMFPTIEEDDSVLIDESRRAPRSGRIYGLRTADGLLVKRLRKRGGRWWADSDNNAYEPRPIGEDDQTLGLVVWWAHTEELSDQRSSAK